LSYLETVLEGQRVGGEVEKALGGFGAGRSIHHRDAEDAEVTRRGKP